tara:strand:+ start:985 stop:1224 length:240 start_codon:yes stop_codon:yes gene_type:complete
MASPNWEEQPIYFFSVHREDFEALFGKSVTDKEWQEVVKFLDQYQPGIMPLMKQAMAMIDLKRERFTHRQFGAKKHDGK